MIAYFDASAFVKLAIDEPGSAAAIETWDASSTRISSLILYPETRAALARASRMERVSPAQARAARSFVDRLWDGIDRVEVTDSLVERAGDLAEGHGLRGYDAVHLASFEAIADEQSVLVTSDVELRAAAGARGFATVDVPA
ncbi:MAG TPA: type II toxin-antitoxin system VapC family toxin [Gaiellaceae bacterium]|nr:type II toxin-antitoxin system VapC family toxin [Gaiellaceae bacterium]